MLADPHEVLSVALKERGLDITANDLDRILNEAGLVLETADHHTAHHVGKAWENTARDGA